MNIRPGALVWFEGKPHILVGIIGTTIRIYRISMWRARIIQFLDWVLSHWSA